MGKETKENELSYIKMERVNAEVRRAGKGQGVQKAVRARKDNIFQAGELVSLILSMQKLGRLQRLVPTAGVQSN